MSWSNLEILEHGRFVWQRHLHASWATFIDSAQFRDGGQAVRLAEPSLRRHQKNNTASDPGGRLLLWVMPSADSGSLDGGSVREGSVYAQMDGQSRCPLSGRIEPQGDAATVDYDLGSTQERPRETF